MEDLLSSYLEKARQKYMSDNQIWQLSDREFSVALGLNPTAINQWRKRNVLPSDAAMMRIAEFGGLNVAQALMDLNALRSDDRETFEFYRLLSAHFAKHGPISGAVEYAKKLKTSLQVTAIATAIAFSSLSSSAIAATPPVTSHDGIVYIMETNGLVSRHNSLGFSILAVLRY